MFLPIYIQFFIYTVGINLFTLFMYIIYHSGQWTSNFNNLQQEYDFIIVGSGTAGSLIAHRIATETNYTFLVLEAGGYGHPLFNIPFLGPLLHGSINDWQYETTPQKDACFAMIDSKCKLTQGKIVGGSSKLNNMIHLRGNISHYVEWFHGLYKKEYIQDHFNFIEKSIFYLSDIKYQSELAEAVLDAAKELGYKKLDEDFNEGFGKSRVTQKNGKRWTPSDYLDLNKHVITGALVEKVLIVDNVAYGVNVFIADKVHAILAKKAVILTAGALNTPKILQLSGIGPSELLKSLHIPMIQDLPVGHNLQDHIGSGLDLVLFNKSLSITAIKMLNPLNILQYFQGEGPWTTPGCEVLGFMSTNNDGKPDIQFMILPVGISSDNGIFLRKKLGIKDKVWDTYFTKTIDKHASSIFSVILHPKSRGNVYIKSADPKTPPLVDPKYLSVKEDVELLIKGLKLVIKFVETDSMKAVGAYLNTNHFPGCEDHVIFSNAYLKCYLKHLTLTSYHPVGTCSMGLPDSKNTVVDTGFKVLNVNRLYVADSSVLPTLPSGNINAAVAMMANIYFETNIKNHKTSTDQKLNCDINALVYQYLFKICPL